MIKGKILKFIESVLALVNHILHPVKQRLPITSEGV